MWSMLPAALVAALGAGPRAPQIVYDDAPRQGFYDASWRGHTLSARAAGRGGSAAMVLRLGAGRAVALRHRQGLPVAADGILELWVEPGPAAAQELAVAVTFDGDGDGDGDDNDNENRSGRGSSDSGSGSGSGNDDGEVWLRDYLPDGRLRPTAWQPARIPLRAFFGRGGPRRLRALRLINRDSRTMAPLAVDDIAVLPPPVRDATWLRTGGARIRHGDGTVWTGRGANLPDTRACGTCPGNPDREEVERRLDALMGPWGATFVRLTMESREASGVLGDPHYLEDIDHIAARLDDHPEAYLLVSLWADPTLDADGMPSAATEPLWRRLVARLAHRPQVLFGVASAPAGNLDGNADLRRWVRLDRMVAVIRAAEAQAQAPRHVVVVPALGGWGRRLDYYRDHPIAASGGIDVAYEVHVYDPPASFDALVGQPAATLPVIIGEFGPLAARMTTAACDALMHYADALEVPYLAWTFHMRCPPNLLEDTSANGCGHAMTLTPSPWGRVVRDHLCRARWGQPTPRSP